MNYSKIITIKIDNVEYRANSLDEAKKIIEEQREDYYRIDDKFINDLLHKLTYREARFVRQLIGELEYHKNNPNCELNIHNRLDFIITKEGFKYIDSFKTYL